MSIYYVSGIVLGTGDTAVNKNSLSLRVYTWGRWIIEKEEQNREYTNQNSYQGEKSREGGYKVSGHKIEILEKIIFLKERPHWEDN